MPRRLVLTLVLSFFCLFGALAASSAAQTFYLDQPPEERTIVGVRALNPDFDQSYEAAFSTLTATYDFYFSFYIGDLMSLRVELPFTHVGMADGSGSDRNQNSKGNLYLGIRRWSIPSKTGRLVYSLGVRPPTEDGGSVVTEVGYLSDLYHIGRVIPYRWTIEGSSAYYRIPVARYDYLFGFEAGPTILFPTQDGEPELLIHYGAVVGARIKHLLFSTELSVLYLVTEDVPDFGDRFDHQFAFGLTLIDYPIKPQLFYEIPLDSGVRDIVNGVIGLRLEYGFARKASEASEWN